MGRLDPAVAELRNAVAAALPPPAGDAPLALVACSGGADSLALAAATAFVAPRRGWRAGLVTVDHALQEGSDERAASVAGWALGAGFAPVVVETVVVAGPGGPEAAARDARYTALVRAASAHSARTVLLGHTRDDQAETVLLALVRGAGPRGLAGMPAVRSRDGVDFARPLLDVSRETTRAACAALGLSPWDDPHNVDPAFARARARALLGDLVKALGPAVVDNLARTATLTAADTRALDDLARTALAAARAPDGALRVAALVALPDAVRTRVLHAWARSLGVPGSALSYVHVRALDALVTAWHGQGPVALPGDVRVARASGRLRAVAPDTGAGR
ncbi:tRNA lysidine(34) synthetase TilS [Luedemannella helvata]|uniref:tRNA(Ile)-lysidine synthase n=1 Tax=Luedemannella helvata TaxID=349315 RepID=A0ABP4WG06_9ACTN